MFHRSKQQNLLTSAPLNKKAKLDMRSILQTVRDPYPKIYSEHTITFAKINAIPKNNLEKMRPRIVE